MGESKNVLVPKELLNRVAVLVGELSVENLSQNQLENYNRIWEILVEKADAIERRKEFLKNGGKYED